MPGLNNGTTGLYGGSPGLNEGSLGLYSGAAGLQAGTAAPVVADQSFNFGRLTLAGHGAAIPANSGGVITSAAITSGTNSNHWQIASDGAITPSATGVAAGLSPSYTLGCSYTNVDGSDTAIITLTTLANAFTVTSTASDTSTSFQLRTLLNTAGTVDRGDTIYLRDGSYLNPAAETWRIRPPLAGYSGTGRIIVRSETATAGLDSNGNDLRGGGAKIGALTFDAALSGDVAFPIDLYYVDFYFNTNTSRVNALAYASSSGSGVGAYYCRFENGPAVSDLYVNPATACQVDRANIENCYIKRWGRGITGDSTTTEQSRVVNNIFEGMLSDAMTLAGENWYIHRNFGFNFQFYTGAHPDWIQHTGALTASTGTIGTIEQNIGVRNQGPSTADAQGIFFDDTPAPYWIAGATVQNNINNLTAAQGISLVRFDGATVSYNTNLTAVGDPFGTGLEPSLNMTILASTSINSTFDRNVTIAKSLAANTDTNNLLISPRTLVQYNVAMPNYVGGSNPGYTTRTAVLEAMTPADLAVASGGFKNADGTFSGALFPATPGQTIGAWNDGTVYQPLDAPWVAAHPPAT